ncbi:MAG: hypothetical protein HN337_08785 [Deltaproteobacteria bacterium]|jgi:phosphatidylglycerophosphate synthase|nr:hypothetical protein [Deltaproteobacteria bacterium]
MLISINPIWITLGPIVAINVILLTSYFSFQLTAAKRKKMVFEGAKNQGSKFLGATTREWWFWLTDPFVKMCVRLRITPNILTVIGTTISASSGILFAYGWFGYAGWMLIFGSSFDMFDGRVARMTGKTSRSGAFFDSVTDRIGEGLCFLGLAVYFHDSWMLIFVILALIGSTMVSYTRARGEAFSVDCSVGLMQRPERVAYLGIASIFTPIVSEGLKIWWDVPLPIVLIAALIFIAVMTVVTAVYRMIYIMNALDSDDERERDSIPQIISKLTTSEGREEIFEKARYGYDRTKAAFSHVVLFHTGGIDAEMLHSLLDKGELPNISKHLVERGGKYEAVGSFPSTTGPSVAPFVTGCFPGTCDIPGVRWFDRSVPSAKLLTMNRFRDYLGWGAYAMDYDLSKSVRTIFEYSKQAANVFGVLNRGCGFTRDPAFFRLHSRFHEARKETDLDAADEAAFHWFATAVRRETDFVLYSFPPMAFMGRENASVDEVRHSYRKVDEYIGRAVELLQKRGMYDRTAMMFVSDCSQGVKERSLDLPDLLSKRYKVSPQKGRMKEWHDSQLIMLPSGTSMFNMYMRNGDAWDKRTFFEDVERKGLIGSFLEKDEIDVLAGRSVEGGIVIQSRRGKAHVLEDADGRVTYMIKGSDPFGYDSMPQIINSNLSLESSIDSNYPDGIIQLLQLFRSRRAGDVILSASEGVSLVNDISKVGFDSKITHGSLMRRHMLLPLLSSVPLNKGPIRTADIFATVLDMLGIEPAHSLDGKRLCDLAEAFQNEKPEVQAS